MKEADLVTAVIPTWNRLPLLREAIASVIAQTYPHWELIVVDDGSVDGTVEHLRTIEDPRLKVIACDHAGNTARMRNIGAAAGTGEWIAFLDSDDLWEPEKLARQMAALRQSGAGWCYTGHGLIDEAGRTGPIRAGRYRALSGSIIGALLAEETGAYVGTLLLRRSLFDDLHGFDERLEREDLDFEFRLALAAEAVALPDSLVQVRDHRGRRTMSLDGPHEHTARVYAHFLRRRPVPALARVARREWGRYLAEAGAWRLARGEIGRAGILMARSFYRRPDPVGWLRATARGLRKLMRRRRRANP